MGTAKKSLGQQNHEYAVHRHIGIERNCDPNVRAGIEKIHKLMDDHYAAGKPGVFLRSILPLLREHIDEPISQWVAKYDEAPFRFSDMLKEKGLMGTRFFDRLSEKIEDIHGWSYSEKFKDLNPTATSLIEFAHYCLAHGSNNEQVLQVTRETDGDAQIIHVEQKPGKKPGGSIKRRSKMGIDVSIDLTSLDTDTHYCQLCTGLNMRANELLRLFHPSSDHQITPEDRQKLRETKLRIHIPGFSPHYCALHDPETDSTGYNKAHARRKTYYSMRRFLIMARQAAPNHLPPGNTHLIRAASFLIVDECPDQDLIKTVPKMIEDWYDQFEGGEIGAPTREPIYKHMEEIVDSFRTENHHLAAFVRSVAQERNYEIFEEAKACGALPERTETLIATGFIFDPIVSHLLKGGTIRIF